MQHAERKTHDDICIYAHPKGEIVFSKKIFSENNLSRLFQKRVSFFKNVLVLQLYEFAFVVSCNHNWKSG